MSLLYCAVCSKDFVSASARTKHEATCKRPPLTLAELTKEHYKLVRKTEHLEKKLNDTTKELNDLKRSRCAVKEKPSSFPEITENDFWDFLDKGLLHLVCSKDWPAYADGKRFMIYAFCKQSNEETWKEASKDELYAFTQKIFVGLHAWYIKNE